MIFRNAEKRVIWESGANRGCALASLEGLTVVELVVADEIAEHAVPFDMVFYVIEGRGTCVVSGEETSVAEGDVLHVDRGLPRGWRNDSGVGLKLLVIRRG